MVQMHLDSDIHNMVTYKIYGIVKSRKKTIAIGDNGKFSTDNERIIEKLDRLGFKRIKTKKTKAKE